MQTVNKRILFLTQFAMLLALEALFCFTPLGSIPLGPLVATLAMLPVIAAAILLGTKAGTLMGFFAGLFSFIVWTFMPPSPMAFVFTPFYAVGDISGNGFSLLICFVPRILTGTVTGLVFAALKKGLANMTYKNGLVYGLSGLIGSLVNTVGVLGGIMLFFGDAYASLAGGVLITLIGTSVLTNGIPEAVVSALIAYAVCRPVEKILKRQR